MPKKKRDYFAALYEVARLVNASLTPSQVLEQIVGCVARTMEL
jgi:hypothetical protein